MSGRRQRAYSADVKRAALLRAARRALKQMEEELATALERSKRHDPVATALVTILTYEIEILSEAIKDLWRVP